MDKKNSFQFSEEKFHEMSNFLKGKSSHDLNMSEIENYINQNGKELLQQLLIDYQALPLETGKKK
ncbi:MAG: hypothetical protein HQK75_13065 [Candidatus Magnetomorum sp.]|nr:hypothetical protein [Candidatus Magnetomorum sp.]